MEKIQPGLPAWKMPLKELVIGGHNVPLPQRDSLSNCHLLWPLRPAPPYTSMCRCSASARAARGLRWIRRQAGFCDRQVHCVTSRRCIKFTAVELCDRQTLCVERSEAGARCNKFTRKKRGGSSWPLRVGRRRQAAQCRPLCAFVFTEDSFTTQSVGSARVLSR